MFTSIYDHFYNRLICFVDRNRDWWYVEEMINGNAGYVPRSCVTRLPTAGVMIPKKPAPLVKISEVIKTPAKKPIPDTETGEKIEGIVAQRVAEIETREIEITAEIETGWKNATGANKDLEIKAEEEIEIRNKEEPDMEDEIQSHHENITVIVSTADDK